LPQAEGTGSEPKNANPSIVTSCDETCNPGGTKSGTVSVQPDLQRLAEVLLSLAEADRRRLLRLLETGDADGQ
jgi:hypothetical protein